MALTDAKLRNAKPQAKSYKLSDEKGLFLLVQPSGGKWWRFKYRFAGKEKSLSLGVYPEISLAEARNRLMEARALLQAGKDPSFARQEGKRTITAKHQNTFETIARKWHDYSISRWTPKYARQIITRLEADVFPEIGSYPIADITTPDLVRVGRAIEGRGANDLAHRAIQYCGQIFTYAVQTGIITHSPATELRGALKPVVKKNHAYLKADELPDFITRLENYDGDAQTRLALKLILMTFVRTTELRGAEWTEIDFEKAEWRIPAARMKMKEPHIVPLSKQAIAVLQSLQRLTGQWKYIFPNSIKPGFGFMSENTMLFALYRMGYRGRTTIHGLRATASTILYENDYTQDVVERQLAHAPRNKVRASYDHAKFLGQRRQMMQWWSDYLETAGKNKINTSITKQAA
ncbi:integrase [Mucilaginibacter gracilis]|uniref:Integrase n=1 Tax=Mucilaginibacter gracilis TaxID=423350 RepID=A0A495J6G8_9SPHI|nr:integrase arm-type DNA-binding domain-containing protein [Mucilaginibacter gracilis]RKR84212.1 integrase [Mucilaginibacter gracilis]